jgi:hypothetical protein
MDITTRTNGNATPLHRLIRKISHGMSQLNYCNVTVHQKNAGKTFYLLKTGDILSLNEWNKQNKPDYIVSGSHTGCEGTKERYKL